MISKLFQFFVTTEFHYAPYIFGLIIALFASTYIYDFLVKRLENTNKLLFKAMKGRAGIYRWAFTSSALILVIARLEGIPIINMRIMWLVYGVLFIIYSFNFIRGISSNYKGRLKNKEKFKS